LSETLTTIEKAIFMKEIEVFRDVGVEQVAEVARLAEEQHFEPGAVIVQQGDTSEHVYVVIDGDVVAERDGIVFLVIATGKGFGDLSLEPGSTYHFTARAATPTHVLRVSTEDLVEAMLEHPEIAVGMVRTLATRLREASQQLADLGRQLQDGADPHPAVRAESLPPSS
jgi:CRP/FNR family cyclic AMP-dependent transcriptional regulator